MKSIGRIFRSSWQKISFLSAVNIFLIFSLIGCASENPLLVSPEPPSKTVWFRVLNYCRFSSSLLLGETVESQQTPKNSISEKIQPPIGDSIAMSVKQNGSVIYKMPFKFKLIRDTKYTVIALPKPNGTDSAGYFGSIITLSTSLSLMLNNNKSYLTIINAFPDSSISFNVTLGCPNGIALAQGLFYKQVSIQNEVESGKMTVSMSKLDAGVISLVNLYDFDLPSKGEYTLIIKPDENGAPELLVLDMNDPSINALQKAKINSDRKTDIRTINFSTDPVGVYQVNGSLISNISGMQIGKFEQIAACQSNTQDIVVSMHGADTTSYATTTFEVNRRYTVLVFDSADKKSALTIVANPWKFLTPLGNNCSIRVVHAAYSNGSMTLSIGARKDASSIGYRSGEVLSSNITYGNISNPSVLPSGRAPITLFTSDQPAKLLLAVLPDYDLQPGKSYLLIITNDKLGFSHLSMIEDNVEDKPLDDTYTLKPGVFTQFVHANPSENTLTFSVGDITSAKVFYKGFLATVMPVGENQFSLNGGSPLNYTVDDSRKRGLVIIGSGNQLFNASALPIGSGTRSWRMRFINITSNRVIAQIETLNFSDTVDAGASSKNVREYNLPGKMSISFIDPETKKSLYRLDGVEFSFGLNYSIIFNGNSAIQKSEF